MFNATNTQRNLISAGYEIAADGVLGPQTFACLLARTGLHRLDQLPLSGPLGAALYTWTPTADIITPLRLQHFLAQTACETAAFTRLKESDGGNPHYFDRYEGDKELGNTHPGDGAKYCGRGLLDDTGRWNYQHIHDLTGIDCVNHPEFLEVPNLAVRAACIFWKSRNINAAADDNDLPRVTKLVNGGLNGLSDRQTFFTRLKVITA